MKVKIVSVLVMCLIFGEVYFLKTNNNENRKNNKEIVRKIEDEISLNEIMEQLKINDLNMKEILKENNDYLIKVIVKGNKEKVSKKINEINNFLIKDYDIKTENDEIDALITLKYSTKGEI